MKKRDADDEAGFTLIELLISISITLVILSSISAALLVFLSNGKYTMKRDDHNAAAILLSSYLDRDFASASTAIPATTPGSCVIASTVLTLWWQEYTATADAPTPAPSSVYASKYIVSTDAADDLGDATCKLSRVFARGPSLASLTTPISTEVLVRNMPAAAFAAAFSGTCGDGTAVNATLAQYSTDTAGDSYTYRGCVNVRQTS
jgi:type II secretory pathway pseudopilin PulG